jgi:hypothetical protein
MGLVNLAPLLAEHLAASIEMLIEVDPKGEGVPSVLWFPRLRAGVCESGKHHGHGDDGECSRFPHAGSVSSNQQNEPAN